MLRLTLRDNCEIKRITVTDFGQAKVNAHRAAIADLDGGLLRLTNATFWPLLDARTDCAKGGLHERDIIAFAESAVVGAAVYIRIRFHVILKRGYYVKYDMACVMM